jgi:hypothetical protein
MLKNCEHAVSPNVSASWAKAIAGFRIIHGRDYMGTASGLPEQRGF